MAVSAGSVFVELGARIERKGFDAYDRALDQAKRRVNKRDDYRADLSAKVDERAFQVYNRELDKVRARVERRDQFRAQLGAEFDNRAFNAYERQLRQLEREQEKVRRGGRGIGGAIGGAAKGLGRAGIAGLAAGAGFAGVAEGLSAVSKAASDAEASQAKVKTMVENAGKSWEKHAGQIDKVIQAQSRMSGFDDEQLAESFANMLRTTGSINKAFQLNATVMDVARSKGMDLAGAQSLVARVYNGSFNGLKRLGISIEPVTKAQDKLKETTKHATDEQVRAAKEEDKLATRRKAITELTKNFAGQAKAYGETQAGATDRAKVAFENLEENLGKKLAPTLTSVADGVSKFLNEMADNKGAGGKFRRMCEDVIKFAGKVTDAFLGMIEGIEDALIAIGNVGSHLPGVGKKFADFRDAVEESRTGIRRMRDALHPTQDRLDELKDHVGDLSTAMSTKSLKGSTDLTKNLHKAFATAKTLVDDAVTNTQTGMGKIQAALESEFHRLGGTGSISLGSAKPLGKDPVPFKAIGGWIGTRGQTGADTVPAMLAPGEAVLNSGQQGVVEGLLGPGFLDWLFANVNRPHGMARGGRAHFAGGGRAGALAGSLPSFGVTGSGALRAIVQQALNVGAGAAAAALGNITLPAPSGGPGSGVVSSSGLVPQVLRALAWARGHGWHGSVTSGFRSHASQLFLWNNASRLGLIPGVSVARPGTSSHEFGQAVDVTDIAGFQRAMASAPAGARLLWRGPTDPVHFSVSGHSRGRKGRPFRAGLAPFWELLRNYQGTPLDFVKPGDTLGPNLTKRLGAIDTRAALASLTGSDADDIVAARQRVKFWTDILAWTQAAGGRGEGGGNRRIREAAEGLASARSTLQSLTATATAATPGPDADLQAINAQLTTRLAAETTRANVNAGYLATFSGPGDIGTGGATARTAVINNFNMPGHPAVLRAIGDSAVAGIALQPARTATTAVLGI